MYSKTTMGVMRTKDWLLSLADFLWSSVVVAPLVILYWRGSWDLLDDLVSVCIVLGLAFIGSYFRYFLFQRKEASNWKIPPTQPSKSSCPGSCATWWVSWSGLALTYPSSTLESFFIQSPSISGSPVVGSSMLFTLLLEFLSGEAFGS